MIYSMSRDLETLLRTRQFPVSVSYGPERSERIGHNETVVVVERDREAGDSTEPPRGQERNARRVFARRLGVRVRVYARSSLDGARVSEHEHWCDQIVDAIHCSLYEWSATVRSAVEFGSGRYLSSDDLGGVEVFSGVVYELQLSVLRGVYDAAFAGESMPGTARATGEIEAVSSTCDVTGTPPGT